MSNIMMALKAEIVRLARKEAKAATNPIRRPAGQNRSTLADLKRRVAALEQQVRLIDAVLAKAPRPEPAQEPAVPKSWISGKGVRTLRQKLGLSQESFAKLVGVTPHAVYLWERKTGMLRMRGTPRTAVLAARGMSAREARQKLEETGPAKTVKKTAPSKRGQ